MAEINFPDQSTPQALSRFHQLALAFIRKSPLSRGLSRKLILRAIRQRVTYPVITDFRGVPFILNLDNTTEAKALFGQYNLEELAFMKSGATRPDAVLVDLGANSGFYTQNFLAGGPSRLALAIEPNEAMCRRMQANYELLMSKQPDRTGRLIVECCGVGEFSGETYLDLSSGVGGAHVVEAGTGQTVKIAMEKLASLLERNGITHIDVLKADIEGYEDRALVPFLAAADQALLPKRIIIEHTSSCCWKADLFSLMKSKGYSIVGKTRGNLMLLLENTN